jgi:hypothetical protein
MGRLLESIHDVSGIQIEVPAVRFSCVPNVAPRVHNFITRCVMGYGSGHEKQIRRGNNHPIDEVGLKILFE